MLSKWKVEITNWVCFSKKITTSIQAELIKSAFTHAHNVGLTKSGVLHVMGPIQMFLL